jgi:hypothetical protein
VSIGYSVEGATDRAFLCGLQERWCPDATLIEGSFRGASGISLRRDVPRICRELGHKGADVVVFLTDAHEQDWREVKRREAAHVPAEFQHVTLYGVAERNVECWLNADRDYLAGVLGVEPAALEVPDPKGIFERSLGISSYRREGERVAAIVRDAPRRTMQNWLKRSPSFKAFYEDARALGKQTGHPIPNERARE